METLAAFIVGNLVIIVTMVTLENKDEKYLSKSLTPWQRPRYTQERVEKHLNDQ